MYNEHNLPARWHAHNQRRMGPILVLADIGYAFQDMVAAAKMYEKDFNVPCKWLIQYSHIVFSLLILKLD